MSSYRQILYHIIFRTKNSATTLDQHHIRELYAYMMSIIEGKGCFLYRINGVEDHIHMLTDLHPSISLAEYMREIKARSSLWLKESGKFPLFHGWADGYAALTYAWRDKDMIVNYIKRQQEHHQTMTYYEEVKILLEENGITVDKKYFP
jgi:REP element-mobilizing transposase RayT